MENVTLNGLRRRLGHVRVVGSLFYKLKETLELIQLISRYSSDGAFSPGRDDEKEAIKLIEAGANPNVRPDADSRMRPWTIGHQAIFCGSPELLRIALSHGLGPNSSANKVVAGAASGSPIIAYEMTLAHFAAVGCHSDHSFLDILSEFGANFNLRNSKGKTPLQAAIDTNGGVGGWVGNRNIAAVRYLETITGIPNSSGQPVVSP